MGLISRGKRLKRLLVLEQTTDEVVQPVTKQAAKNGLLSELEEDSSSA